MMATILANTVIDEVILWVYFLVHQHDKNNVTYSLILALHSIVFKMFSMFIFCFCF